MIGISALFSALTRSHQHIISRYAQHSAAHAGGCVMVKSIQNQVNHLTSNNYLQLFTCLLSCAARNMKALSASSVSVVNHRCYPRACLHVERSKQVFLEHSLRSVVVPLTTCLKNVSSKYKQQTCTEVNETDEVKPYIYCPCTFSIAYMSKTKLPHCVYSGMVA